MLHMQMTVTKQPTRSVFSLSSFSSFYLSRVFPCISLLTLSFIRKERKCIEDITLAFASSY